MSHYLNPIVRFRVTNLITNEVFEIERECSVSMRHITKRLIEQVLEQTWMWTLAVELKLATSGGTFMGVRFGEDPFRPMSTLYRVKATAVYNDEQRWGDGDKEEILRFEYLELAE